MSGRYKENWLVKNKTDKHIVISDLPKIPSFAPNQIHDLLNYYNAVQIHTSDNLVALVNAGMLEFTKIQPTCDTLMEMSVTPAELSDISNSTGPTGPTGPTGTFEDQPFAGVLSKPSFTDNGDGTIMLGNGSYQTFTGNDFSLPLIKYTKPEDTYILEDMKTNYIIFTGSTGNISVTNDRSSINQSNVIPIITIYRDGNELHLIDWDELGKGLPNKLSDMLVRIERFKVELGGLALGEVATRTITVTSGIVWHGGSHSTLGACDSSSDTVEFWYHSSGNWTKSLITQYNNTQYDDGTDLQTLSAANRYAVNWIFRCVNTNTNHLFVVLGNGNYKRDEAEASSIPLLPDIITSQSILVGRIIVQKSLDTAYNISSAFVVPFTRTPVTDHSELSNLQGGSAGEYYHFTLEQYNALLALIST